MLFIQLGYQSALMVPTEILAEQHFDSLAQLFPELKLALLTGGMKAAERRETLAAIENGQVDMIVGTHALIQEAVRYHALGLVIIDEQHRWSGAAPDFTGKGETILMSS